MTSPQAWLGPSVPVCCRGCHRRCRGLTGTPLGCCPGARPVPTAAQGRTASLVAFRAGPVLLGDNHRSEGTLARVCLLCTRGGKHRRIKGSCSKLGPTARSSRWPAGRCPAPCLPLRCPSPGKFLASPLGLSPSQQQPQCLTTKAPARQSPEMLIPVRAMSRRDPRYRAARPAGHLPRPSPHFPLPTAGTASTANLIFVVINFCGEGEKKRL